MPRSIERDFEGRIRERIIIDPDTGCHVWTGAKTETGYGRIWYDGKVVRLHRLAYERHTGTKIPKGKCVLHDCDSPPCVNPAHLFLGTQQDNIQDCVRKGRLKIVHHKGEKHIGSKLTNEQVVEIRARTESQRKLAKEYGVSFQTISRIKRHEQWRHIP